MQLIPTITALNPFHPINFKREIAGMKLFMPPPPPLRQHNTLYALLSPTPLVWLKLKCPPLFFL